MGTSAILTLSLMYLEWLIWLASSQGIRWNHTASVVDFDRLLLKKDAPMSVFPIFIGNLRFKTSKPSKLRIFPWIIKQTQICLATFPQEPSGATTSQPLWPAVPPSHRPSDATDLWILAAFEELFVANGILGARFLARKWGEFRYLWGLRMVQWFCNLIQ